VNSETKSFLTGSVPWTRNKSHMPARLEERVCEQAKHDTSRKNMTHVKIVKLLFNDKKPFKP